MLKKVLLFVSTFAVAVLLFLVYQWGDPTRTTTKKTDAPPPEIPTTQMADADAPRFKVRNMSVPPGAKQFLVVYDDRGRARIRFRSEQWRPISENEWHMTKPEVWQVLSGGQPIHVTADEGQVIVAREQNDNYNPKRGWLRGNVHILIDRTDEAWRSENPDRALPEQHPEFVVDLWLDDVEFDLDMARLESKGRIKVQSYDATVEGMGLTLVWNEVDRRIDLLEVARGRRIELRRDTGFIEFAVPGADRMHPIDDGAEATVRPAAQGVLPPLETDEVFVGGRSAGTATRPSRAGALPEDIFVDVTSERRFRRKRNQIDTYAAVFDGGVRVEQKQDGTSLGTLATDMLELLFDFGDEQREATDVRASRAGAGAASAPAAPGATSAQGPVIELTWSGRLTLKPAAADKDAKPGNRFHAVATGNVQVNRGDSRAACERLEFHNESEQVWLSGSPVEVFSDGTREFTGNNVFYDRRNGTARIEGPGSMSDLRTVSGVVDLPDQDDLASAPHRDPTGTTTQPAQRSVVRWTKGVSLRFGILRQPGFDARTSLSLIHI